MCDQLRPTLSPAWAAKEGIPVLFFGSPQSPFYPARLLAFTVDGHRVKRKVLLGDTEPVASATDHCSGSVRP